ncbi:MAG: DUF5698 domain-containing protein, partial [Acidobacteria bacterium]|nr:DUF5698 domain-containing protein [Acidobacteriota bacterium]
LAMVLGFFEVLIWVTALSEVIARVHENFWLVLAFAGGFAAGNAVGIAAERYMALGSCVVRMISQAHGEAVADSVRPYARLVTTFRSAESELRLVYAICSRSRLPDLLATARTVDPEVFHAVERLPQNSDVPTMVVPTGWRAIMKKK